MKKIFMISLVLFAVSAAVFAASNSKEDKSVLTAVEEDFDFVYEVVNNTSGKLTVATFISNSSQKTVAKAEDVVIEKGESYQFKYNLKTLKKLYGSSSYIGCYFEPEGRWRCGGWMNKLTLENQKHTVKISDASNPEYCMDAENIWDFVNIPSLPQNEEDYDFIYEIVNNTSGKLTVSPYLRNSSADKYIAITEKVTVEAGETYQFKYKLDEIKAAFGKNLSLGSFYTPEGKWRCGGWEGKLNSKNKKFTVTCKDTANPNYCLDIDSKWSSLK